MKTIKQNFQASLFVADEHVALLLMNTQPTKDTGSSVCLRFALTRQAAETPVFPALVLDDWGKEIRGPELYEWVREFGDQFPRAELFGFDLDGREVQCFLRQLELHARLPCYAYENEGTLLNEGLLVEAVALPDESLSAAVRIRPPAMLKRPLRSARVSWWRVNPRSFSLDPLFD